LRTVFAGSDETQLRDLFQNRAQAFFGFASAFELTRFDENFIAELSRRHRALGWRRADADAERFLTQAFLGNFERSPARARRFYELLKESDLDFSKIEDTVLREIPVSTDWAPLFAALTPLQKAVLRFVASNGNGRGRGLFSQNTADAFSEKTRSAVTPSAIQTTVRRLCGIIRTANGKAQAADALLSAIPNHGYAIADEKFAIWLRRT
jgi:hypothetical protein